MMWYFLFPKYHNRKGDGQYTYLTMGKESNACGSGYYSSTWNGDGDGAGYGDWWGDGGQRV